MKMFWVLGMVLGMGVSAVGQAAAAPVASPGQPASDSPRGFQVGGAVKPPVPLSMPDPEFSKEARKKKISGGVLVGLIVDVGGNPQQVHVKRSLADQVGKKEVKAALSLDAKAVEAVKQYRFKPATRDGVPVPVWMNVEVNFQIF